MLVLVVDDAVESADTLGTLLEIHGYSVAVAYDGPSALAAAAADRPNAGVLDLALPGMDGFELARQLREQHGASLRLIAYTGWADDGTKQRALLVGFDVFVTKPASLDVLVHALGDESLRK